MRLRLRVGLRLEPALGVDGGLAAVAGRGDGLAVAVIVDIARDEDALDRCPRVIARDEIPLGVAFQLAGEDLCVGTMADRHEEATGLDLGDWFTRCVRGTEDPQLADELLAHGLELRASHDPGQLADGASAVWLGLTTSGVRITGVLDGSPAAHAGLSPGDELCTIDRLRVANEGEARAAIAARKPEDVIEVGVFRRHRLTFLQATVGAAPPTRYEVVAVAEPTAVQSARYQAWMGEALPAGQSLATVTTTSRWL